jgi:dienelactone hydrolase
MGRRPALISIGRASCQPSARLPHVRSARSADEGPHDTVSRQEGLRDILVAYDFLAAQHNVDADSIAVVGSSYGGYLAALLTALRPVKWLALRAPALYKDSEWTLPKHRLMGEQKLELYRRQAVRPDESRALRACTAFTGDVLVVESEQDTVVPHQVVVNYREACISARSLTYRVIGADHALSGDAPARIRQCSSRGSPKWSSARVRPNPPRRPYRSARRPQLRAQAAAAPPAPRYRRPINSRTIRRRQPGRRSRWGSSPPAAIRPSRQRADQEKIR